jgi:fucose permease
MLSTIARPQLYSPNRRGFRSKLLCGLFPSGTHDKKQRMVALIMITFFVRSLLTNILGPIIPDIMSSFQVSLTAAGLLAFAFFIAYGVLSIPAGFLVERYQS